MNVNYRLTVAMPTQHVTTRQETIHVRVEAVSMATGRFATIATNANPHKIATATLPAQTISAAILVTVKWVSWEMGGLVMI